ncbi:hypothetical protein CEXT_435071 [Caerostris extrusa]|uniref:Uncharacterized protein n=1 Tax=Caerostris extrusa TaxID=172846 RepID=A0AAV4RPM8_CAEEX|nr:hypothetical protein CEXT_435071 [Caerostris extrusa]
MEKHRNRRRGQRSVVTWTARAFVRPGGNTGQRSLVAAGRANNGHQEYISPPSGTSVGLIWRSRWESCEREGVPPTSEVVRVSWSISHKLPRAGQSGVWELLLCAGVKSSVVRLTSNGVKGTFHSFPPSLSPSLGWDLSAETDATETSNFVREEGERTADIKVFLLPFVAREEKKIILKLGCNCI